VLTSFKYMSKRVTWQTAQKMCLGLGDGWRLAVIHSEMDNARIADLLRHTGSYRYAW